MLNIWTIFVTALKLGLTSFGGPSAHIGYFQQTYVKEKKWLTDKQYIDLVALSQFLPGPASSQVGMGIGLRKGGILGSLVAFIGFTMPSVIILIIFVIFMKSSTINMDWLMGLKLVAVAVVAQAVFDMGKKIIVSKKHVILLVLVLIGLYFSNSIFSQVIVIFSCGLIGLQLFKHHNQTEYEPVFSKKWGAFSLLLFFVLLIGLPIIANIVSMDWIKLFSQFFIAGSLVFGGGHVVLPLLETQFVGTYVTAEEFLVGYGLTQAVPGPLFTFASYLGMVIGGIPMAIMATIAIFLPAFLLIVGAYPFWAMISRYAQLNGAIVGMNVAVIGILLAAFISPIVSTTITSWIDGVFAFILLMLLSKFKWKPWIVVIAGIVIGVTYYR